MTLKLALTLEGRMATRAGDSKWITSPEAAPAGARAARPGRRGAGGAGTVRRDNPRLTVRLESPRDARQPLPVILATQALPTEAQVFHGPRPPLVFTAERNTNAAPHSLPLAGESPAVCGGGKGAGV